MATLPTSSQVTDSGVTNAQQKTYFGNMLDFLLAMLGSDSADKATARANLGVAPRATRIDVASAAGTVDLTANAPNTDDIQITGALAITAFTVAVGRVIRVTAGGAFTLANNASIVTQTGATLQLAAGDTFALRATATDAVEVLFYKKASIEIGTILATTSGTSRDLAFSFDGVKEFDVQFSDVSTNGTDNWLLRFMVAGSPVTTGYRSVAQRATGSTTVEAAITAGFGINSADAGAAMSGSVNFKLMDAATFRWAVDGKLTNFANPTLYFVGGTITLAGIPSGVRLTTTGGTNTFDAAPGAVNGAINVLIKR
jgi:hypothetical protein